MDQFGIRALCPAPRSRIEFVREDAHGNRDGDAFGIEIPEFAPILPIETGARKRRVGQPGDRDVVEDVVSGEAFAPVRGPWPQIGDVRSELTLGPDVEEPSS